MRYGKPISIQEVNDPYLIMTLKQITMQIDDGDGTLVYFETDSDMLQSLSVYVTDQRIKAKTLH